MQKIFCQDLTIDSLKRLLSKTKQNAQRFQILTTLTEIADDGDWQKFNAELLALSNACLLNARTVTEKIAAKKYLSIALNNEGVICFNSGKMFEAEKFYLNALKLQRELNLEKSAGETLNNLGDLKHITGNFDSAKICFMSSLRIRESLKDYAGTAQSLNNIGGIYDEIGNFSEAIDYYQRSLNIRQRLKNKYGIAQCLHNMATIYAATGENEKAIEFCKECLSYLQNSKNPEGLAAVNKTLAALYITKKEFDSADKHVCLAFKLYLEMGNKLGVAQTYLKQSEVALARLNFYKKLLSSQIDSISTVAKIYAEKGLAAAKDCNALEEIAAGYAYIAQALMAKEKFEDARINAFKSWELATHLKSTETRRNIAHTLYKLFLQKKRV